MRTSAVTKRSTAARAAACAAMLVCASAPSAFAEGSADGTTTTPQRNEPSADRQAETLVVRNGRQYLVPELADSPYRMSPGPRRFLHRLSFSPGFGRLGRERLYAFRLAYNPNTWLGYEAGIGHNPGDAVHALLNTLSAVVRRPFSGRLQPYATAGYGMMLVYPGESLNADPVTKNALAIGAGLEVYVRNDVALRADARRTTILGNQRGTEGTVAYDYDEVTVGLAFYRDLGR